MILLFCDKSGLEKAEAVSQNLKSNLEQYSACKSSLGRNIKEQLSRDESVVAAFALGLSSGFVRRSREALPGNSRGQAQQHSIMGNLSWVLGPLLSSLIGDL